MAISTQRQAVGTGETTEAQLKGDLSFEIGANKLGYAVVARLKDDSFDERADIASSEGNVAGGASSNVDY